MIDAAPSARAIWRILPDERGPCPSDLQDRLIAGISASVPGAVHQDLLRAGLIPDPFFAKNATDVEWIADLHWILELDLSISASEFALPACLILDGVDVYATVFLNDVKVGVTDDAFMRYALPVDGVVEPGINRLRFEFAPINEVVEPKPGRYNHAFYDQHRIHVRRMQCTFGWDWVHKFVTFGLASAPRLVDQPEVVFPGVLTVSADTASARVEARWDVSALPADADWEVEVEIYAPEGGPLNKKRTAVGDGLVRFEIAHPQLWHPRGYGAQPLYRATFQPIRNGVFIGDEARAVFGIRQAELLLNFDAPGSVEERMTGELAEYLGVPLEPGREFGFRINGVDIFAMGGNWVPCDPFPGPETEAKKQRILRQFAKSGGNTIRMWGGGIYESPAFYDTCAELGIMILHDFMMACADYPHDDPAFMAKLVPEIDQTVLRLRGHSAIVHWYGDNENAMFDGEVAPGRSWYDIYEQVTRPALERHDVGRSSTASCPFFGRTSFDPLQGDSHISVFFTEDRSFLLGDMKDYKERLDKMVGRFGSECALYGAPDRESLLRFMPGDQLDQSDLWEYHTKDNPSRPPGVTITMFEGLEACAANILGSFKNGNDRLGKLAYIHYETVRMAVESSRRKQPFCRGILFWMLNDCWPASGWSLIDYYARPKAAYYGFRYAAQPVRGSFRPSGAKIEAWVSNNSLDAVSGAIEVFFETWAGKRISLRSTDISIAAGTSQAICEIAPPSVDDPQGGIFFVEGKNFARGWHFHGMPAEMSPPSANLEVDSVLESDGSILCRITADSYARVVTLSGNAIADDNYFDLRAGETKVVRLVPDDRGGLVDLFFRAWNTDSVPVDPK